MCPALLKRRAHLQASFIKPKKALTHVGETLPRFETPGVSKDNRGYAFPNTPVVF